MGVRPTSNFERPSQKKKSGKLVFWSNLKLSIALQWGHGCPEEFVSAACNSPPHTMVSTLTSTYEFQACLPNPKELEDGLHKGSANRPTRSLRNTHPHIPCSACSSMIMITPRYVRPVRCFLCSSSLLLPITLFRTPPPQSFFILSSSSSSSLLLLLLSFWWSAAVANKISSNVKTQHRSRAKQWKNTAPNGCTRARPSEMVLYTVFKSAPKGQPVNEAFVQSLLYRLLFIVQMAARESDWQQSNKLLTQIKDFRRTCAWLYESWTKSESTDCTESNEPINAIYVLLAI